MDDLTGRPSIDQLIN